MKITMVFAVLAAAVMAAPAPLPDNLYPEELSAKILAKKSSLCDPPPDGDTGCPWNNCYYNLECYNVFDLDAATANIGCLLACYASCRSTGDGC